MSEDGRQESDAGRSPRCPICGRPRAQEYRPFCSARCRDVDLGRWFGEVYTVPAVEPGYDEQRTKTARRRAIGQSLPESARSDCARRPVGDEGWSRSVPISATAA